jgi:GNAT superfamily N-acetyltransferase
MTIDPMTIEQPPSQLRIRPARPEDAGKVAKILHESFVEFQPLYTPGGFAATALAADQVVARIHEGPVWLAIRGNESSENATAEDAAIGTVAAVRKGDSVYVRGMAVVPAARGLRAGSQLLEKAERWASDQGISRLFLSTTPFLHSAIRLYERHGYRRMAGPLDLCGTPLFAMEKILPR